VALVIKDPAEPTKGALSSRDDRVSAGWILIALRIEASTNPHMHKKLIDKLVCRVCFDMNCFSENCSNPDFFGRAR